MSDLNFGIIESFFKISKQYCPVFVATSLNEFLKLYIRKSIFRVDEFKCARSCGEVSENVPRSIQRCR